MAKIDPMYNLVNTILDDKEVVIFLGAGASMEGTQDGKRFPSFDELIDRILKQFGFDPKDKKNRLNNFLEVIKKWEKEKQLAAQLSDFLKGYPGAAHYHLAALSIALFGKSSALLYLTTNYDNLMNRAFLDLERNPERRFETKSCSLRFNITGSEFQEIVSNLKAHMNKGKPVIIKLFGDLTSEIPVFRKEDMKFQPEVENKLIEWMKKPMIVIGYSFSDRIIEELLISARGTAPVFLVNPSKIPASIDKMERVHHIKSNFSEFMSGLFGIIEEREPGIKEKVDRILQPIGAMPELPDRSPDREPGAKKANREKKSTVIVEPRAEPVARSGEIQNQANPVKKILILAANPEMTDRLRLDIEVREIDEGLRLAKHRDRFTIHQKWAIGLRDLRRALLVHEPQIVHFTGHGNEKGLIVEDEAGFSKVFSSKALAELFKLCANHVECVILNACYSARYANGINKHINYVIGMRKEIKDRASIEFAVGFYDALGAGRSVEEAFQFGRVAILSAIPDISEHLIPILKTKKS
jgi:hypothetical protein